MVLFFIGLALSFSSAATNDEFNILSPDGTYKKGKFNF